MKEINVVFATDEGYAMQTYIAMQSVMESGKKSNQYVFWIMCGKRDDLAVYLEGLKDKYVNCVINYLEADGCLGNVPLPMAHITKPTYYRLLLPALLDVDRCIYLDSDIIVCGDLEDLYSVSMEGYELAGVLACAYHGNAEFEQKYAHEIDIPAMDTYINAGVLLMDLNEMRKNDFSEKAISMVERKYPASDQDIINILSYGKIKKLSPAYNYQAGYADNPRVDFAQIYGTEDALTSEQEPAIIHYLTPQKPWEFLNIKYAEKWWEVCRKTPYFPAFSKQYCKSFYYFAVIAKQRFWQERQGTDSWYDMLNEFDEIHLYGAGRYASRIVKEFRKNGIAIESIYVSNAANNPCELDGIKVEAFSQEENAGKIVLISASTSVAVQIYRELLDKDFYHFCMLDCDAISG